MYRFHGPKRDDIIVFKAPPQVKNSVQNEGPAGLVRSVVRGKDAGSAHIQ